MRWHTYTNTNYFSNTNTIANRNANSDTNTNSDTNANAVTNSASDDHAYSFYSRKRQRIASCGADGQDNRHRHASAHRLERRKRRGQQLLYPNA